MNIPCPLSHAYLITGGCEASRAAFADRLAAAYLCEGEQVPCGTCRHCRKLASGVHPDLSRVTIPEDKKEILVDQARGLLLDGDGRHSPAQERGQEAQGEDILRGQIINGALEGQAHKELVKARLMVHDDQVLPAVLFLEFFNLYTVLPLDVRFQQETQHTPDHPVTGKKP